MLGGPASRPTPAKDDARPVPVDRSRRACFIGSGTGRAGGAGRPLRGTTRQRLQKRGSYCAAEIEPRGAPQGLRDLLQGLKETIVLAGLVEEIVGADQFALAAVFGVGVIRQHVDSRARREGLL